MVPAICLRAFVRAYSRTPGTLHPGTLVLVHYCGEYANTNDPSLYFRIYSYVRM
jgi:hypothetical protein